MESPPKKSTRKEVKLMLEPEIAELLARLAGSPRKQSDYITRLLRAAEATQDQVAAVEQAGLPEIRELLRGVLVELAELRTQIIRR